MSGLPKYLQELKELEANDFYYPESEVHRRRFARELIIQALPRILKEYAKLRNALIECEHALSGGSVIPVNKNAAIDQAREVLEAIEKGKYERA